MWYIYTMEYYSAIKKNEFMKFLDKWMDLEDIFVSEVTQSFFFLFFPVKQGRFTECTPP